MSSSTYLQATSKRKLSGLAWVLALHVILLWALQSGLIRTVVQKTPTVVQAILLPEDKPNLPTPAPPVQAAPKTPSPPAAKPVLPSPSLVPPAEVQAPPAPLAIAAVTAPPTPAAAPAPQAAAAPAKTAPTGIKTAAGVNTAYCEKPAYPTASRRLEEEGTVILRFLIGVDGKVIQAEIEKSSGFKRLDDAARAGLSKCLFNPATVDGKPEQAWARMPYQWRLD